MSIDENIDWLFFDLGNTLVDEDLAWQDRISQLAMVLHEEGFSYNERQIEDAIFAASEMREPSPFRGAIARLIGNTERVKEIARQAPFKKSLERLYPEALPTLQQLARHYSLGVIGNQSPGTVARLETFGIAPYISICVASAEEGVEKPDLEIYRRALLRANCPPERAVMIGDRVDNDIVPAKALGMHTIRVLQGFARAQQPRCEEEVAELTLESIADLVSICYTSSENEAEGYVANVVTNLYR